MHVNAAPEKAQLVLIPMLKQLKGKTLVCTLAKLPEEVLSFAQSV